MKNSTSSAPLPLESLLAEPDESFAEFVARIHKHFLDLPYLDSPLIGGPHLPEKFVARIDGFDCVTLVETLLALYFSGSIIDYPFCLTSLRYFDRNVSWSSRKHYLSSWCSDNCSRGFLIETTESLPDACETWKRLSVLEGLEPLDATYRTAPFSNNILKLLRPADVICFASDKLDLDYFHLGLLVKIDGELELFHASKSLGSIAFENLQGFCERTQCSRISVYRVPIKNDISSE